MSLRLLLLLLVSPLIKISAVVEIYISVHYMDFCNLPHVNVEM
jgi:hypothetical protein